jgi:hypothetical protein
MASILIYYKNNKFNFKFNINNIDFKSNTSEQIVEIINNTNYDEVPLPFIGDELFYYNSLIILDNKYKEYNINKKIYLTKSGDSIGHPSNMDKITIKMTPYSNVFVLIKWYNSNKKITVYRKNLIIIEDFIKDNQKLYLSNQNSHYDTLYYNF